VLDEWTVIDPAAVAQFIDAHPDLEVDQSLVTRELISTWASLDPKAARGWMEKKGESEVPERRRALFEGWYENDPAAAASYVLAHAAEPGMKEPISDIVRALYFDSKEEARKFIEDLPDENIRRNAFQDAFAFMSVGEETELGEPNLAPRAIGDWMTQFPPSYWKETLSGIFKWVQGEDAPQPMLAWIAQQPLTIRDAVAAEYAKPFHKPMAEALAPILEVPDPTLREQLFVAMFKHETDPADQVKHAIEHAALPPAQKDYVLQIFAAVQAELADERSH
jgi:hypothetical protein